jgi:hypothetical protein
MMDIIGADLIRDGRRDFILREVCPSKVRFLDHLASKQSKASKQAHLGQAILRCLDAAAAAAVPALRHHCDCCPQESDRLVLA